MNTQAGRSGGKEEERRGRGKGKHSCKERRKAGAPANITYSFY